MPSLLTSTSAVALAAAEKAGSSRGLANGQKTCPRSRHCQCSALWQTTDSPDPQEHGPVTSSLRTPVPRLQKRDYNSADPSQTPVSPGLLMVEDAQVDLLQSDPSMVLIADATAKTQVACQDLGHILGARS